MAEEQRPKIITPVSAGFTLVHWFYMYKLPDGTNHVMNLLGVENYDLVRQHAEQMHPGETVDLHLLKHKDEIFEAIQELAKNPNWYPVNEQTLNAINKADVMGQPIVTANQLPPLNQ